MHSVLNVSADDCHVSWVQLEMFDRKCRGAFRRTGSSKAEPTQPHTKEAQYLAAE